MMPTACWRCARPMWRSAWRGFDKRQGASAGQSRTPPQPGRASSGARNSSAARKSPRRRIARHAPERGGPLGRQSPAIAARGGACACAAAWHRTKPPTCRRSDAYVRPAKIGSHDHAGPARLAHFAGDPPARRLCRAALAQPLAHHYAGQVASDPAALGDCARGQQRAQSSPSIRRRFCTAAPEALAEIVELGDEHGLTMRRAGINTQLKVIGIVE